MSEPKKPGTRTQLGTKKKTDGGKKGYNQHEKNLAAKLGGYRQPQSGALPGRKGDVSLDAKSFFVTGSFLLDSKQSSGSTIIVSGMDLTKITREATEDRKEPGLILTIGKLPATTPSEWILVPLAVFSELLENQIGYSNDVGPDGGAASQCGDCSGENCGGSD